MKDVAPTRPGFWKAIIEDLRDAMGMALLALALNVFPSDSSRRLARSLKGFCEEETRLLLMTDMDKYQ